MLYLGVLGELFRGGAAERGVLGELFRGGAAERGVLGEFFRGTAADGPHGACERWPQPLWAHLVSEEKLRMQFPSRHFKSRTSIVEILPFLACCGCGL